MDIDTMVFLDILNEMAETANATSDTSASINNMQDYESTYVEQERPNPFPLSPRAARIFEAV